MSGLIERSWMPGPSALSSSSARASVRSGSPFSRWSRHFLFDVDLGALLRLLLEALGALLEHAEVEQESSSLNMRSSRAGSGGGGERGVVEAAHDVDEHVGVAHRLQDLGREGAARRAAGPPPTSTKVISAYVVFFGLEDGGEEVDPLVRDLDVAEGDVAIGACRPAPAP